MSNKTIAYYVACISCTCVAVYLLCVRLLLIFSYSVDLDGAEFFFINFVQVLEQGKELYRNPLEFPFMGVQHMPVYPYLLYYVSKFLKYDLINDIHQMLVVGRWIAWFSMLLNIYLIKKIFDRFNLSFLYFTVAIALYLLLITGHFFSVRPDGIKVTLFTLLLYSAFEYVFYSGSKKYFLLSVLSATAMFLLKQDSVINIYLLLFLLCVYVRNAKAYYLFLVFSISLFVTCASCYFIFGKHFFINTVLFNIQVITDIANSINIWIVTFSIVRNFPLLLLAVYGAWLALRNYKQQDAKYFLSVLSVICFVIVHITILRPGSYLNYAYELLLLLVLNAALLIKDNETYFRKHLKIFAAFVAFYFLSLSITNRIIHSYTFDTQQEARLKDDYFTALKEREQILSFTKDEMIFMPNFKNVVYFGCAPYIWGYEMHFDRVLEVFIKFKIKSKLLFVSTDDYDAYFTTGKVKYIITENNELNDDHVHRYYPHYVRYQSFEKFCVYIYASS